VQGTIKIITIKIDFFDVCQPESFQRKADILINLENGKFANRKKYNPDAKVIFIRSRNIPRA